MKDDSPQRILLKITGEAFLNKEHQLSADLLLQIIKQIKALKKRYQFALVIGGGNFFRGNQHGKKLGITPSIGHQIGILATMMNGLILKDLLEQEDLHTTVFSALDCPEVGLPITHQAIEQALLQDSTLIFVGGTGIPFFSTDTTAVVRSLQIQAHEIWKGTNVDGIYDADPRTHPDAKLLPTVSYNQAITHNLRIMDKSAFALATEHHQVIRIFNLFSPNSLLHASQDPHFGSRITTQG